MKKQNKLTNIKVGDKVVIECYTSMGGTDTVQKVTRIERRYDEKTGKPYKVIFCGNHMFSGLTGSALNPPIMYFISRKV